MIENGRPGTAGLVLGIALAATLAAGQAAARAVDETVAAAKNGTVSVENLAGSVRVKGWDEAKVRVRGELGAKVEDLVVEADGGDVSVEVVLVREIHGRGGEADLELTVPRGCRLEVESVSASIAVEDVRGTVELESVSGAVDVRADAKRVEAATVSGAITVRGRIPAVEVGSVSGTLDVKGTGGVLEAETTSGAIEISGGEFERVECSSVSGRVRFEGEPARDAELDFESFSGEVVLRLPAGASADIEVETFSGTIESELGGEVRREEFGPGAWLETTLGDGSAAISASTFSGSVALRRK